MFFVLLFMFNSAFSCKQGSDLSDKTNAKVLNQKRQKSPYPYYNWQVQQHKKDLDIYIETKREHLEQHHEHEKQHSESMNEGRESTRQVCETLRETQEKIAFAANNASTSSIPTSNNAKKGVILFKNEAIKFLSHRRSKPNL
nr:uncharacterized protein LOC101234693 [Hydra vulgaris]